MTLEIPQSLMDELSKGRVSLFLGAGASREADFPSAEELANHIADTAGARFAIVLANQPLDMVCQHLYLQPGYGKQWVRQTIIEFFEKRHRVAARPPSVAHALMTTFQWRTIFTTNYDRLVEIAYDSTSKCVQRSLPIYAPDPQVLRHEADVVRLIKLNGSVDEASRNVAHELVVTFAEQQEARSRNAIFYSLLREEAINGPIIFVGFRFVHPGASQPGTSPEFQQLQELMREMGPAARWHYCVSPYDSSPQSEFAIEILRASKVETLSATFGDFLDALVKAVRSPVTPIAERPSVIIPVAQKSIEIRADDYEKDRRQFEVIGTYIEEIVAPSVTESLNGQANWASFRDKHVINRLCESDFHKALTNSIKSAPELFVFTAPPGWGKTFFLRHLAVDFYRERRPIIWLNPFGTIEISGKEKNVVIGTWDAVRIDHILGLIADKIKEQPAVEDAATPLIIADNCSERAKEVVSLFREMKTSNRRLVLIFSVRDNEFPELIKENPLLKRARQFSPEESYDSKREVRNLIDFCIQHRVANIEGAAQREIVASNIIREEADGALLLSLQVIFDKQHRPFSQIVEDLWLGLSDEVKRDLVLKVASLHRFGSSFSPRLYSLIQTVPQYEHGQALKSYRDCLTKGILFERDEEGEPCVFTLHSLVAEQIIKASGSDPSEIDKALLELMKYMKDRDRDLEIIRRLLKLITDYKVSISSEQNTEELFRTATDSTNYDWVVCQQFAKYLVQRHEYELALAWVDRALEDNPDYGPLHHSKGNILRRWAMELLTEGHTEQANDKFQKARKLFAISRISREPDEYGYVTHLDMLIYLMNNTHNDVQKANLKAEGVELYREGLRAVPEDRFNLLVAEKYRRSFDLNEETTDKLCNKIKVAVADGKASNVAAAFLAQQLYKQGMYTRAIAVLNDQRRTSDTGVLLWVKEAELHAREGHFGDASKCIDAAKRRERNAESEEVVWSLTYWELITAVVLEDFKVARDASSKMASSGFFTRLFTRQIFPRGYIWRLAAKSVESSKRSLKEHAKIWSGRVDQLRSGGRYGRILMRNMAGESFYLDFMPRYFTRADFRQGDYINFVMTILPNRLRADDVDSKPFINTVDDLFVP